MDTGSFFRADGHRLECEDTRDHALAMTSRHPSQGLVPAASIRMIPLPRRTAPLVRKSSS